MSERAQRLVLAGAVALWLGVALVVFIDDYRCWRGKTGRWKQAQEAADKAEMANLVELGKSGGGA